MSDAMKALRSKLLGNASQTIEGESQPKPNAMLVSLLKSFGVDPDTITAYAEGVKGAVTGQLAHIDAKLDNILSICITLQMKQAELEHNMGILLARGDELNHEDQFAQMAEHPLTEPMQNAQPLTPTTLHAGSD
jgi:hypothetical protein